MSGSRIDLNQILPPLSRNTTLTIQPEETPEELRARLRREDRRELIKDYKGVAVFVVTLLFLVGAAGLGGYNAFFNSGASADQKHWGWTVFFSIISGSASYLLGRKVGAAAGD